MILTAEDLDRKIIIQRLVESKDAMGAIDHADSSEWTTLATVWAKVVENPSREVFEADRDASKRARDFIIRRYSGLTTADRISFEGAYWNIIDVQYAERAEFTRVKTMVVS